MTEVKELYTWLLTTTKKLNINIYYSIDFAHNCNFYVHNIFKNEREIFCFLYERNINNNLNIINICSIFSILCNICQKNFKIFLKKMCIFLSNHIEQKETDLIYRILYNLKNHISNHSISDNLEHNILYNIIREAYLLSSIDIYYHINKSKLLINNKSKNEINIIIKYFENYYLKLYDNLELFNNYSIQKFYEISEIEKNKINHIKNTLCA